MRWAAAQRDASGMSPPVRPSQHLSPAGLAPTTPTERAGPELVLRLLAPVAGPHAAPPPAVAAVERSLPRGAAPGGRAGEKPTCLVSARMGAATWTVGLLAGQVARSLTYPQPLTGTSSCPGSRPLALTAARAHAPATRGTRAGGERRSARQTGRSHGCASACRPAGGQVAQAGCREASEAHSHGAEGVTMARMCRSPVPPRRTLGLQTICQSSWVGFQQVPGVR